jgi:hypothetical protein
MPQAGQESNKMTAMRAARRLAIFVAIAVAFFFVLVCVCGVMVCTSVAVGTVAT